LLSDAVHGNFKTLEARALRDALKYSYLIFEFPELDNIDEPIAGTVNEIKAQKTIDEIAKAMPDVPGKAVADVPDMVAKQPIVDIEKVIREEYKRQKDQLDVNLITL